ncbi:MAG: GGDEF domain-containing protein [Aphanothece saxicola GSE-SYN-MK-01-06B]|jgi:diguanylate cyclase (GGDEF)-like protein|nr:GGDEF domain-containing protein [Aphanothece saxicola GSE-SYN-MK-01-06B]
MSFPTGTMALRRGLLLGLLAGLAVLGNACPVSLCFSIQILLGSIASTLALLWLRGWWNVPIAAMASLYTWTLWGHPWAIVIFSAEALWLALFVNRFSGPPANDLNGRIIVADVVFWLLVGTPLVFFLYGSVLHIDPTNVAVTAAKQAVNGVANTVVAFLLFVLLQLRRHSHGKGLLPLRGLVFSVVLASIILPSLGVTLLSCSQLQRSTQEGVLENLRTVGEAAGRIDPLQLGEPSRGLPASVGSAAFLLTDIEGNQISSNPGLFLRLQNHFQPAPSKQIELNGLQILVPKERRPALKVWINGYWSTTVTSPRYLVQVVQPAAPAVLKLQDQSLRLLLTLFWVMLLGILLSEAMAWVMERQLQMLRSPHPVDGEGSGLSASLEPEASEFSSSIIEVQELACRLQEQNRRVLRLSQDLSVVSANLKQSIERQRQISNTDPLTGTHNRSDLQSRLAQVCDRARACSVSLSCLAFSVRGLRQINTVHGRPKGDEILQLLITDVRQLLHANDELFRIGGSEFLLLLWDHPLESARSTAEQIRQIVSETGLPQDNGSIPKLAMNAGVSLLGASDSGGQAMLSRVELALNQSRELGGHQVVVR